MYQIGESGTKKGVYGLCRIPLTIPTKYLPGLGCSQHKSFVRPNDILALVCLGILSALKYVINLFSIDLTNRQYFILSEKTKMPP